MTTGPPFGSLDWLSETNGILDDRKQRMTLILQAYRQLPRATAHRIAAEWWRRRPPKGRIEFDWEAHPRSAVAERIEREAAGHLMSPRMLNHSLRTWAFGSGLAERDGVKIDHDLFFIVAMLHDVGLSQPTPGRCFTGRGADLVFELGEGMLTTQQLALVADAITHHITPGLTIGQAGPLAYYLQAGSALDLGGLRVVHLPVDFVRRACAEWPTDGVNIEAGARWRAEAEAVKDGRAHLLQRWTRFSTLSRWTPVPP